MPYVPVLIGGPWAYHAIILQELLPELTFREPKENEKRISCPSLSKEAGPVKYVYTGKSNFLGNPVYEYKEIKDESSS